MLVLQSGRQYCPHRDHDGRSKSAPGGPTPATRAFWPGGWRSFQEAVAEYTSPKTPVELPDLDTGDFA